MIVGVSNPTVNSIDDFHGFVFLVMRTVGLVFKFLVVITLLTMDGVIDQQMLIENRRSAIFIIFLAATIFTPDPTLFSMPVLAIPLTLLYEISVWAVGKFGWKEKRIENN